MELSVPRRRLALPSVVLGTLILVISEVMFFCALLSAFLVIRAGRGGAWVAPPGVRLPTGATVINTAALLLSGVLMYLANRAFERPETRVRARWLLTLSTALGGAFVVLQGLEWVGLLSHGMTMRSGVFGACFFLLIGCHGLHAFAAVLAMGYVLFRMESGRLKVEELQAMGVFWAFVVGVWPVLYGLVYF